MAANSMKVKDVERLDGEEKLRKTEKAPRHLDLPFAIFGKSIPTLKYAGFASDNERQRLYRKFMANLREPSDK